MVSKRFDPVLGNKYPVDLEAAIKTYQIPSTRGETLGKAKAIQTKTKRTVSFILPLKGLCRPFKLFYHFLKAHRLNQDAHKEPRLGTPGPVWEPRLRSNQDAHKRVKSSATMTVDETHEA